jgi:spore maturation protein CgeB
MKEIFYKLNKHQDMKAWLEVQEEKSPAIIEPLSWLALQELLRLQQTIEIFHSPACRIWISASQFFESFREAGSNLYHFKIKETWNQNKTSIEYYILYKCYEVTIPYPDLLYYCTTESAYDGSGVQEYSCYLPLLMALFFDSASIRESIRQEFGFQRKPRPGQSGQWRY